jgi:hypothetical protein
MDHRLSQDIGEIRKTAESVSPFGLRSRCGMQFDRPFAELLTERPDPQTEKERGGFGRPFIFGEAWQFTISGGSSEHSPRNAIGA